MTVNELEERIKRGRLSGIFVFAGEEDYLKRHYLGRLRRAIVTDDALAPFTHMTYEGATVDFAALTEAVMAPAMMADAKLIEWHLADFGRMKEKELAALEELAAAVTRYEGNTVVFTATPEQLELGTDKRPSKLAKWLTERVGLLNFARSTDAQLVSWIGRHFAAADVLITRSLPSALIERVGHSMDVLSGEIDKLCAYAKQNALPGISEKELALVASRTVESDAFSFSNALLDGKTEEAYRYLGDMKRRKLDPITVLGQVARLYGDMLSVARLAEENMTPKEIAAKLKIHEYKAGLYHKSAKRCGIPMLMSAVALCAEIDATMKNGTASYIGLERLVARFSGTTVV